MPYVMVPVPEEHVEEVMQFMLRAMAKANQTPWDRESIDELFAEIDEFSKALLGTVARAVEAETELFEEDATRAVQLNPRETSAIIRELNDRARDLNRPSLLGRRPVNETLPNGRVMERNAIFMEADIAPLVVEAEKADLAGSPATNG